MKYRISLEDSNTQCIVVKVPIKFRRIGARKKIVLPDSNEQHNSQQLENPLVIAISRAHRWQELIDSGKINSVADLAVKLNMDPSQVGRILRLTLLAPDIVEGIILGTIKTDLSVRQLTAKVPVLWDDQRNLFLQ